GARADARRLAGAAAVPRALQAEGRLARLPRQRSRRDRGRDLPALARGRLMGAREKLGKYRPLTYFQLMEVTLRELLVEKGITSEAEVKAEVEAMRARTPERGARVVAKAWTDPDYKKRLLKDATKACEELGLEIPQLKLVAVENTPATHNV